MTLIDAQERQRALDATRSFIVQAPAGSGKTGVLTQRILTLLALVERPEQILAITFTKKAAAEMRNRVMEALHQAAHEPEPENEYDKLFHRLASTALQRDQEKQWGLLENPSRLRLQTIDSLCSAVVRENPLVSGLGVQFGVEEDATELYAEASRSLLAMLDEGNDIGQALYRVLGKLDNQYRRLSGLIVAMLEQRDHWLRDITETQQDWETFRQLLLASLTRLNEEAERRVRDQLSFEQQKELHAVCIYALNQMKLAGIDHPALQLSPDSLAYRKARCDILLTKDLKGFRKRLDKNGGFPTAKEFSNPAEKALADEFKQRAIALIDGLAPTASDLVPALQDFITAPAAELTESQWQLLTDLVILVRYAAAHLKLVFQEQKSVDFSEVALAALHSLGHPDQPGDSLLALDERIQHILVDEFQDTSVIQVDLLERLTEGWTQNDGRTLFLVGDPMQSIYAFRKADVGLFLRLWREQQVGRIPLQALQLRTNFRSSPFVLNWVNATFRRAFPRHDDVRSGAVRYADSAIGKSEQPNDTAELHLFTGPDRAALAQAEADWIAQKILAQQGNPSIAILVKGKAHILAIADSLRKAGIPFQAVEIERLVESQIITDLLSLYRAYLSPGDKVAWFALLRGPWCGFTLEELQQVAAADLHPWRAVNRLCADPGSLSASAHTRLQALATLFTNAYRHRFQQPFAESLRQLALDLGMAATASSAADVEAMDLFFDLLAHTDSVAGIPDPNALDLQLEKLFVPPETVTGDRRPVQVMTMHKSKGLEFDLVFLPQLQRKTRRDDRPLILIDKQTAVLETRQELFMAPLPSRDDTDNGIYDYLWKIRQQRSRNESVRLLYVATTRARRQLFLTGCLKQQDDKRDKPDASSLLAVIWPVVEDSATLHPVTAPELSTQTRRFRRVDAIQLPPPRPQATTAGQDTTDPESSTVLNADNYRRQAGILVHRLLESWAYQPNLIDRPETSASQRQWEQALFAAGVNSTDLPAAIAIVQTALARLRQNPARLDWLFRQPHSQATAEWRLSSVRDGQIQHFTIDRTFVQDGVRHIIDYKTSSPNGDPAIFLRAEIEHYRPQLYAYRQALAAFESLPCRTYLYFPLMDHLQEIED